MPQTQPPDISRLLDLVRRLRAPDGCPWDREQRLEDVRAYLLEEAHEAAAALDLALAGAGWTELGEELGDLLFQIVFIAELAAEAGAFDLTSVLRGIHHKMIARHPHVFGSAARLDTAADVVRGWEQRKAGKTGRHTLLDGLPRSIPALVASLRLTQKAAGVGFDWPDISGPLAKVREELAEFEAALEHAGKETGAAPTSACREELGDLLFAVANVARKAGIEPEGALAAANAKFRRRFAAVEEALEARGMRLAEADLATLDGAWETIKQRERRPGKAETGGDEQP